MKGRDEEEKIFRRLSANFAGFVFLLSVKVAQIGFARANFFAFIANVVNDSIFGRLLSTSALIQTAIDEANLGVVDQVGKVGAIFDAQRFISRFDEAFQAKRFADKQEEKT